MDFLRSLMFVPGSRQRMLDKALGLSNLDVALFDLEDGVAPSEKPTARQLIAEALSRRPPGGPARCGPYGAMVGCVAPLRGWGLPP